MNIPFHTIDWSAVEKTEHVGDVGTSWWQVASYDGLRIRLVEYSPGYIANHWCAKGHIVYCLEGSFESHLKTGEIFYLTKGMSYVVSDDASEHHSHSPEGVTLLIIDGDFLKK